MWLISIWLSSLAAAGIGILKKFVVLTLASIFVLVSFFSAFQVVVGDCFASLPLSLRIGVSLAFVIALVRNVLRHDRHSCLAHRRRVILLGVKAHNPLTTVIHVRRRGLPHRLLHRGVAAVAVFAAALLVGLVLDHLLRHGPGGGGVGSGVGVAGLGQDMSQLAHVAGHRNSLQMREREQSLIRVNE
jgi:hypothetical protein